MHVALDRHGNAVVAGEGTFRVPMGADQTDNTLSNPVATAQMLRDQERVHYATMAQAESDAADYASDVAARQAFIEQMAQEHDDYVREAVSSNTAGEHPLTYIAALQSMAGGSSEQCSPLNGYLLSQDGVPAYDRAMNGYPAFHGNMGQLLNQLQAAATSVLPPSVAALIPGATAPVVQGAVAAPAASASPFAILTQTYPIAGYNIPYWALGLAAALVVKKIVL